jgi:polysaccharide pyruvyl transferase WcaK-like protein
VARATVRDERSRTLLEPLVAGTPVERTADPVFLFAPGEAPLDLASEGLETSDPLVVVSVRRWRGADRTAAGIATAVDRLAEAHGARIAFLPLGGAPDADASTVVIRRCRSNPVLLPTYSLPQAAQVIARTRLVVGMRLHALVIAARLGIPFTALPYDPKVGALLEELRYPLDPLFVPGGAIPPDAEIESRIDAAWARRGELAEHLRAVGPEVERLAERNFDVLDELLTNGPDNRQA